MCGGAKRSQKKPSDPLELKLQVCCLDARTQTLVLCESNGCS